MDSDTDGVEILGCDPYHRGSARYVVRARGEDYQAFVGPGWAHTGVFPLRGLYGLMVEERLPDDSPTAKLILATIRLLNV
jgi:hypothetical protein